MAYKDKAAMIAYNDAFNARAYDRIGIYVRKGRKAEIKARAQEQGLSVAAYIVSLIDADMGGEVHGRKG